MAVHCACFPAQAVLQEGWDFNDPWAAFLDKDARLAKICRKACKIAKARESCVRDHYK